MTDQEAYKLTNDVFILIKKSKTVSDLEVIPDKLNIATKNTMSPDTYPKIEFGINKGEIQSLLEAKVIDNDYNILASCQSKLLDPLTKLLYATAWKNGDLKKIKHIIKGVVDCENQNTDQDEALVFYQFGKYLTKSPGQPIIDQHVIRAFAVYNSKDISEAKTFRQIKVLSKREKPIIGKYKKWLMSEELTKELRIVPDYCYYIDKLLFATGKTIKSFT